MDCSYGMLVCEDDLSNVVCHVAHRAGIYSAPALTLHDPGKGKKPAPRGGCALIPVEVAE